MKLHPSAVPPSLFANASPDFLLPLASPVYPVQPRLRLETLPLHDGNGDGAGSWTWLCRSAAARGQMEPHLGLGLVDPLKSALFSRSLVGDLLLRA